MGILLRIIKQQQHHQEDIQVLFLDFEKAAPTESEMEVYHATQPMVEKIPEILEMLKNYSGASELIRQSIANPADSDLQERTWEALKPLTGKLRSFYEFSVEMTKTFQILLRTLCGGGNATHAFETKPALAKRFAETIDFTIKFDEMKMSNPALQNDLSYYRRVSSHGRMSHKDDTLVIPRDLANKISIFLAEATPFMTVLSQAVVKYFNQEQTPTTKDAISCFATMVRLCKYMIETPELCARFQNAETKMFCLRVMVGLIILYDHVDPVGAFAKQSMIDVRGCIKILRDMDANDVQCLINSLRYTTKHFNDCSTPSSVRDLLCTKS